MKINLASNYEHSPRKELIKEMTILFAAYEVEKVKQYFAEDIEWRLVGDEAAVSGEMKMKNGKIFGFSDFYKFSNTKVIKVAAITSFVIELK